VIPEGVRNALVILRAIQAEVYKKLGYRQTAMVGEHLTVSRPMVKAKGHIVPGPRT
jgi:hypothetical protein